MERVRAGRRLDAAALARTGRGSRWRISFDSDHETIPLRDGETSPGKLAQGEYGARVARAEDPAAARRRTACRPRFFMPAVSALLHPDEVEAYVGGGHEVGVHGWIHERNTLLAREDELDLTGRAIETLEKLTGDAPGRHPHAVLGLLRPHAAPSSSSSA